MTQLKLPCGNNVVCLFDSSRPETVSLQWWQYRVKRMCCISDSIFIQMLHRKSVYVVCTCRDDTAKNARQYTVQCIRFVCFLKFITGKKCFKHKYNKINQDICLGFHQLSVFVESAWQVAYRELWMHGANSYVTQWLNTPTAPLIIVFQYEFFNWLPTCIYKSSRCPWPPSCRPLLNRNFQHEDGDWSCNSGNETAI